MTSISRLVLNEVKQRDLKPGRGYLLYREYPSRRYGNEWIFSVWKLDRSGWAMDSTPDRAPNWPSMIFESPDVDRITTKKD